MTQGEIDQSEEERRSGISHTQFLMTYCGAGLVLVGGFCLVYAVWTVVEAGHSGEVLETFMAAGIGPFTAFFLANSAAMVLMIAGIIAALLRTFLMRKSIAASAQTIANRDRMLLEPLIAGSKKDAISQYVRISSLTGVTGFFTKLGFTGLPLVTAALGVLLILLAIFESGETSAQLMDLAKLVIGAFIGSFVQRKVEKSGSDLPEDNV